MRTSARFARLALAPLAIACAVPAAFADVLVVAPFGAPYTSIQAAVNVAQDGDTILVRPGDYTSFMVNDKSLVVAADAPGAGIGGRILVQNLAASRTVVISGFTVLGVPGVSLDSEGTALWLRQNSGSVRVERCSFTGANGTANPPSCTVSPHNAGWPAALVESNGGDVAFAACQFTGGRGSSHSHFCYKTPGGNGGHGLASFSTRVAAYDCTFTGGPGGHAGLHGGRGGTGAFVTGTLGMFASNGSFTGGTGGDGLDFTVIGGAGGDGVFCGLGARVQRLACAAQGGAGGYYSAPAGVDYAGPGHYFSFASTHVAMQVPSIAREGTSIALTVNAQPGDDVYLFSSLRTDFRDLPSWRGVLLTQNIVPVRVMILGPVPASGVLDVSLGIPDQGPGFSAATRFLQVHRRAPTGEITLGSFAAVTVLDSSY